MKLRVWILFAASALAGSRLLGGPADIRIHEIHYHPAGNDSALEFVEIFNAASDPVDLTGWFFEDAIAFEFPRGTVLDGGSYLVVAADSALCRQVHGEIPIAGEFQGRLSDGGERIRLMDPAGRIRDECRWGDSGPWPAPADGGGPSLEKLRPRALSDWPDSWAASRLLNGTPGSANSRQGLEEQPAHLCPVRINEVAPSPGGSIELQNAGDDPWDLSGHHLSTTPRLPGLYTFPAGTTILPGAFIVVSEADLGAEIPAAGCVLLTDPTALLVIDGQEHSIDPGLVKASARFPDGTGSFVFVLDPTPGSANAPPPATGVVIHEIMYHPSGLPGQPGSEWIELFGAGPEAVDLTGWRFARGIDFAFPVGTRILPGEYLVVAQDPEELRRLGVAPVVGGYESKLENDEELILLRDRLGNTADRVHYADDGSWPAAPDGGGPSLELIHPGHDNESGQAWDASTGWGTPGAANSAYRDRVAPLVTGARHRPTVPRSSQPVTIACEASCPTDAVAAVRLGWRRDGEEGFTLTPMADDGLHGDGDAGDGTWGAVLDPLPDGTILGFYIVATSARGLSRTIPPLWEEDPEETMLLQVEDDPPAAEGPLYRIIMTGSHVTELETRDVWNNEFLDATFICGDEVFYNVDIRYRGRAARVLPRKSYRVDFSDDERFMDLKRLNLNSYSIERQHLGMTLFRSSDVPAPLTRPLDIVFCGELLDRYVQTEVVNEGFLERVFPLDDDGNLYRGELDADLVYLGTDKESYRPYYNKRTNEGLDDFSDIIDLCDKFTSAPDETFEQVIASAIDVDEWARFFAVQTLLNTLDGIYHGWGDDYFLYRRPSDGLFVIIPWDVNWTFSGPTAPMMEFKLKAVERFLQVPAFATAYHGAIDDLLRGHFSRESVASRLEDIAPHVSSHRRVEILSYVVDRREFVEESLQGEFGARLLDDSLVGSGAEWRWLRGTAEPSAGALEWTRPDFDDSAWETGIAGLGYGDGDDGTILDDMRGTFSTVYARKTFPLEDPGSIEALLLSVDHDDGFVAYLNGVEVARSNAPGEPGAAVPHDAVATAPREAGTPCTFRLANPGRLLRSGKNVLAVEGLNDDPAGSDFSLSPVLGLGAVIRSCSGTAYVAGTHLRIEGTAPRLDTSWIRIGGKPAAYDQLSGKFAARVSISPGPMALEVEAVRPDGTVGSRASFDLVGVTSLGGVSGPDTWMDAWSNPYFIGGTLTVPAAHSLNLGPGVEVLLGAGARIVVRGTIRADGEEGQPVRFDRLPCEGGGWGGMEIEDPSGESRLVRCEIRNVQAAGEDGAAISARGGALRIDACRLAGIQGTGIRIADCVEPAARIESCLVEAAGGAGIDAEGSAVLVIESEVKGCGGPGVRLGGPCRSVLELSAIHHNEVGVAIRDGHLATVDHSTIADNATAGVACGEGRPGRGIGRAEVSSSISYFNGTPFVEDAPGAIHWSHCAVDGTPLPPGEGNFTADPLFVDRAAGDYRLQAGSPCLGAGERGTDVGAFPSSGIPLAPSALAVAGTSASRIVLEWIDNSINEDGFELERKGPGEEGFSLLETLPAGAASATDEDVAAAGTYSYRIRAFNESGVSPWCEEASGSPGTLPLPPESLIVTSVSPTSVGLGWDDVAEDEEGYEVFRKGPGDDRFVLRSTTGAGARQFTDEDPPLTEGEEYGYRVRAFNSSGPSAWSNDVTQRTGLLPEAPRDLRAVESGPGSAVISWTDGGEGETAHAVELRSGEGSPWRPRAVLGAGATSFEDGGLEQGATCSWRVRAENPTGASPWAGPVTLTLGSFPAPIIDVSIAEVGLHSLLLAWRGSAGGGALELERASEGAAFTFLGNAASGSGSYLDPGLKSDTWYSYRVRETGALGASSWSPVVSARTGKLPEAPQDVRLVDVKADSVRLTWTDSSGDESGFEIERREAGGDWVFIAAVPADQEAHVDAGLDQGTTYAYRVRAFNRFGASSWSAEASGDTEAVPEAPAAARAAAVGNDYIILTWEDRSDDEVYFEIQRSVPSDPTWWVVAWMSPDKTTYRDRGLPSGQDFLYRVQAWNYFGGSEYSNEVYCATRAVPGAPLGLREVGWSETAIELAWKGGGGETEYVIKRSEGAGGALKTVAFRPADAPGWTDTSVVPGTMYTYVVLGGNFFGLSDPSDALTTTPGVALLDVTPAIGDIEGGDEVAVRGIHLSPSAVVTIGASSLRDPAWMDEGLVAGVTPPGIRVGPADVSVADGSLGHVVPGAFDYALNLLRGDVNGDRRLLVSDAVAVIHYLFGDRPPPYCQDLADANSDGSVSILDALYLLRYLFAGGQAPPSPRVDCL